MQQRIDAGLHYQGQMQPFRLGTIAAFGPNRLAKGANASRNRLTLTRARAAQPGASLLSSANREGSDVFQRRNVAVDVGKSCRDRADRKGQRRRLTTSSRQTKSQRSGVAQFPQRSFGLPEH